MKGRKHVLFEKSLFAHQGKLLRHIQLSLTRRQAMAIPPYWLRFHSVPAFPGPGSSPATGPGLSLLTGISPN